MRERSRVGTFLARAFDVKTDERAYRVNAKGEEAVGPRLEKLVDHGWRVRTVGSRRVLRLHELPSCNHPRPRKIQLARDHLWVRTHQPGSVQLHEYHLRVDL